MKVYVCYLEGHSMLDDHEEVIKVTRSLERALEWVNKNPDDHFYKEFNLE